MAPHGQDLNDVVSLHLMTLCAGAGFEQDMSLTAYSLDHYLDMSGDCLQESHKTRRRTMK